MGIIRIKIEDRNGSNDSNRKVSLKTFIITIASIVLIGSVFAFSSKHSDQDIRESIAADISQ